jgi:hypothetical protein
MFVVSAVAVAMVVPGLAHAQSEPGPKVWIGGSLGLSPVGTLKAKVDALNLDASDDAGVAFQINGLIDFRVTPLLSIGFAPGIIFNVKATNDDTSGSELDLPIRVTLGGPVAPKIRMYGFVSPGYSIFYPPSDADALGHPAGFMLGFGGGAGFRVAPGVMLTGELGYQFRFLSNTVNGVDFTLQNNYLTFAVGLVAAIH